MKLERLYHWQAITPEGTLTHGEIIGSHRQQAHVRLIARGYQPLALKTGQYLPQRYWKGDWLSEIIKQLAALLQAGLPLLEALQLITEQHERPGWRCVLREISTQIAQGKSLSEALTEYPHIFPVIYRSLIAVGELTGKLDECCLQLAQHQQAQSQLHRKVVKALRYPCFVLIIATLVSILMLTWVLPEFSGLYASFDAPLPWFTQQLLHLAEWIADNGLAGLIITLSALLSYLNLRQHRPIWRKKEQSGLLRLPVISHLIRGHCLSQIFNVLAMTQHAGLTLPAGLDAAATIHHPVYQAAIQQIQKQIQQGITLHQAIQQYSRLFPAPCQQLIRVGEETGALDTLFAQLAQWHERKTRQQAEALTQTLEPMLMLIVGGMVGALVIGMYLPIFQLGNVLAGA
ncbi:MULTISPECIES: protein transport protein HofC [unclassified Brenneria]|uniref:protein transport protein HofC n=1 Tax=unclassified Brenneria TaxID=2634434 RepID=UPI0018F10399|nr:protein transport protein HofC [Brenneria sp. L3-3C-1]MBJ7222886.1 protein transport protein HofC [Brenneria sp. L3-3C-1]MEE3644125.1 protein transport protein HofC [Brenneria sp. L3_3C_1]